MQPQEIITERLLLAPLDAEILTAMFDGGSAADARFAWPVDWPDDTDRRHVARWLERARNQHTRDPRPDGPTWGPKAIVVMKNRSAALVKPPSMVGHIGFHGPPVSIEVALSDPSYSGSAEASADSVEGVVEVGYTVFQPDRGHGYATEALAGLIRWAAEDGTVSAILATVASDNQASLGVLERVGGFVEIGTCEGEDGAAELVFRRDLHART